MDQGIKTGLFKHLLINVTGGEKQNKIHENFKILKRKGGKKKLDKKERKLTQLQKK